MGILAWKVFEYKILTCEEINMSEYTKHLNKYKVNIIM